MTIYPLSEAALIGLGIESVKQSPIFYVLLTRHSSASLSDNPTTCLSELYSCIEPLAPATTSDLVMMERRQGAQEIIILSSLAPRISCSVKLLEAKESCHLCSKTKRGGTKKCQCSGRETELKAAQ